VNRKVVDLITLYNFYKGSIVFFSTVFTQIAATFECHHIPVNRSCWQSTNFSTLFHSKFEMPFNMKIVSLKKLENYYIGRFWSV
jgi:hypothetical protein